MRNFTMAAAFLLILNACHTTLPPSFAPVSQSIHYGPQKAEGALIWLHGWCSGWKDCSKSPTPHFIDPEFNRAGWDIFRLNVPPSYMNHDNVGYYSRAEYHARLSLKHSQELRSQGYKRIVLAGYSGGAISVLFAGTMTTEVETIIGIAPCCGVNPNGPYIPDTGFYDILRRFEVPRVMLFFFAGELNAPESMGAVSEQVLLSKNIAFRIYDQPEMLNGHNAGYSPWFTTLFGQRMIDFVMAKEVLSRRFKGEWH